MNLNNWSDKIVFSSLKLIKKGHLILTNYDDEKYLFGDPSQKLKVKICALLAAEVFCITLNIEKTFLPKSIWSFSNDGVDIINDNIGTFDANAGTVTINYFNPQSIASGGTQIKLKAVPANQSAIAPERNELLEYDTNESKVLAVNVSAQN